MKQAPELQLIFHILQPHPDKTKLVAPPTIDWHLLYKLAIRHRVWHQLYAALAPLNNETPISVYAHLAKRCHLNKMHILATAAETSRIAREFTKHNILHCFIKGLVLNVQLYGSLGTRPCKDIDVWVDAQTYQQAIERLLALGYKKTLPTYELNGFQKKYYMNHKHDMEFYHAERKIWVELHFRLNYFGINFFQPTAAMLQSIKLQSTPISTLRDEYHLLYLMVHGSIHAWTRLRWLNDIVLYINSGKCDLNHVMSLAKEIHCVHIVEQTLLLVQQNFGKENPALSNLVTHPSRRALTLATMAQAFIINNYELSEKYSVFNKMFFKYRFYLATLATTGQKLNAISGDLFKIDYLFPHITFPDKLSFLYYLIYPFWVIKLIISRSIRGIITENH